MSLIVQSRTFLPLLAGMLVALFAASSRAAAPDLLNAAKVTGGLCVMIACDDTPGAAALAKSGRFLVHILESDPITVESARAALHKTDLYGLASADSLPPSGNLPYTEDLVNVILIGEKGAGQTTLAELLRVLRPEGILLTAADSPSPQELTNAGLNELKLDAAGKWRAFRKPWPAAMDTWSHPRRSASGNAVSNDQAAALPKRIRWIAGPQMEISNFVTAGGRAFFGGILARDGFNGLRLWDEKLTPNPARGGFNQTVNMTVQPIATPDLLIAFNDKQVQALDAATGKLVRSFKDAVPPTELLVEGGQLIVVGKDALQVYQIATGQLLWKQNAPALRSAVVGDGLVFTIQGEAKSPNAIHCRDLLTGKQKWLQKGLEWMPAVKRLTYNKGHLACEISTVSDDKPGNEIHMLAAKDGAHLWERTYIPGAAHKRQARAMFIGNLVWVMEAKKIIGLDPDNGSEKQTFPAANVHCFPPVATTKYVFGGEMDLTDLSSGKTTASQITKQACSRDAGVVPANGLIYTFPKHCICWPMLRDFAALAAQRLRPLPQITASHFVAQQGPAKAPAPITKPAPGSQWPVYRHDALRSGGIPATLPSDLKQLWTLNLGGWPAGEIAKDWRENYFIRAPIGPPVIADNTVFVTRPDAHQVIAIDLTTGQTKWTFTANGRVDTAPTIHKGLCLFGAKSGYVFCVRADTGELVWKLQAAPVDERIIAYGQLESPWPVPGSILIDGGVAYFGAGRQPLADGGVLIFAAVPETGKILWVKSLDSVPQKNFYGSSGLEFDNFDLLQSEGSAIGMSRWLFDKKTGEMTCRAKSGFAQLSTDDIPPGGAAAGNNNPATNPASVLFPRGSWSYAPRNESEQSKDRPYLRPLAVFKNNALFGCLPNRKNVYRRDFTPEDDKKVSTDWFAGWSTYAAARKGGDLWPSQRLAHDATWNVTPFEKEGQANKEQVGAMVLVGDRLALVGSSGTLAIIDTTTGATVKTLQTSIPAWDGLAAVNNHLLLTTQDGKVICFGPK